MAEARFPYPHEEDPDIFREALAHSEATTGFTATLIERDYYCSLILQYLFDAQSPLVFRGATCLSKVYADFYRLSEDLDLVIPVAVDTPRTERRAQMQPVRKLFEKLPVSVPGLTISETFQGHNLSRQYIGYLEYQSAALDKRERIKIEIGIREPLLRPAEYKEVRTLIENPFTNRPLLPIFSLQAMALRELYAEKVRAAMTRERPAIRDFFDLFHAIRDSRLSADDSDFLNMVRGKLDVPGNSPVDVSPQKKNELQRQLEGQLRPVLRPPDFEDFNLDMTFQLVSKMAERLSIL